MSGTERHIFLCDAERASALIDELRGAGVAGDVVRSADDTALFLNTDLDLEAPPLALAFARQSLPMARLFDGLSVNEIVRRTSQAVIEACGGALSWDLHIVRASGEQAPGPNRARLLRLEIEAQLKKRRRRLLRGLVAAEDSGRSAPPVEVLVQLYLESRDRSWLSIVVPGAIEAEAGGARWRRCLSPWPGGLWQASENREPPSRAYRKLAEAFEQFPWIGRGPVLQAGDSVVDLGASPGGWSWVALQRGARVVAVDRSPLREDLMRHPKLVFVRGDAFQYRPDAPVDWLVCDVIAFPDRILELLRAWAGGGLCRNFCVTVKFRGSEDYGVLRELKNMLNKCARDFAVRRLSENKNEATVFGCL